MIKFIADVGANHNQDWIRCRDIIDTCKAIGCSAVKFQLFDHNLLYAPGYGDVEKLKKSELPLDFIPKISNRCREIGIDFGCTPFSLYGVDALSGYVDFFKISSFDVLRYDLIKKCLDTRKHLMISFGLATDNDIKKIDKMCIGNLVSFFYCVSDYPAKPENCHLIEFEILRKHFPFFGWSDHTGEPGVIFKAIEKGAELIEFHIDLDDMNGFEAQYGHCWNASKIKNVIRDSRIGCIADSYKNRFGSSLYYDRTEYEKLMQRADPDDGMRPMKVARKK